MKMVEQGTKRCSSLSDTIPSALQKIWLENYVAKHENM